MSNYIRGTAPTGTDPDASGLVPVAVLATLGLVLETVVVWNLLQELETLGTAAPPLVAASLGTGLAATICYASYRQVADDLAVPSRWRMTGGAVAGAVVLLLVFTVTILVRMLEGRAIAEPQFALYTAAGAGAVLGSLVGYLYAQARRDAHEAERARNETEAALEEVRRTRDRIELVNSILRHDIANDIMIIRARAGTIADRAGTELAAHAETVLEQVGRIEDQLERTRGILDAVSDDGERFLEPMSLSTVLQEEADALETSHPEAAVSLDTPADLRVQADDLLPDVVGNVLSNAVTHNDRETPQIDVSAEATPEGVVCRIADNGPGIPDEQKRAVLEEGYSEQADGGHGFGLFFVRTMMDAYDGTVRIEDANPRGAVFVLTFERATE
ncbi:ATP-binding protein [Haloglomus litoreum]|uniref:ATP-binding protein n=1 Tax=Haloglomus litoreum TaxID=3034026 RepID=UPI0023E8F429|nr:ATP-binding protein [Haloglomus sp. DT116]